MRLLILELILADELADLSHPPQTHLVVKNGNFTFLLLDLILADQLVDLSSQEQASSGHGWQYEISTVRPQTSICTGKRCSKRLKNLHM